MNTHRANLVIVPHAFSADPLGGLYFPKALKQTISNFQTNVLPIVYQQSFRNAVHW